MILHRVVRPALAGLLLWVACSDGFADEIRVQGGSLLLAGTVRTDQLVIGPGALLGGDGTVDGATDIAGTLSPGGRQPSDVGLLAFSTTLVFRTPAEFDCYAAAHTALDRIASGGPVSGVCVVRMSKAEDAVPLQQVIVAGGDGSDFLLFSLGGESAPNWELSAVNGRDLVLTDTAGDTDGDGIPDWWEYVNFAGRTNCPPGEDPDGDTMNNLAEFVANTSPTNSESRLHITAIAPAGEGRFAVSWSSASNRLYDLLYSADLLDSVGGVAASNIAGMPPENTSLDDSAGAARRFYRVRVRRP